MLDRQRGRSGRAAWLQLATDLAGAAVAVFALAYGLAYLAGVL